MVPPPWRGARSLLHPNVSSNSKSKAGSSLWSLALVNHWAFGFQYHFAEQHQLRPTISIIWLMSPVDVRMYGLISFTLSCTRRCLQQLMTLVDYHHSHSFLAWGKGHWAINWRASSLYMCLPISTGPMSFGCVGSVGQQEFWVSISMWLFFMLCFRIKTSA